jgi:PAS domain S-box-containing protein
MTKERISEESTVKNSATSNDTAPHFTDEGNTSDGHLKIAFDTMPDWVWEIDQYGFITYSNPQVERILGYAPDIIKEKPFLQLVPKSDSLNARALLTEDWDIKPQVQYLKHYFISKDDEKIQLETTGCAFFDAYNNSHGTRFFSRPVNNIQPEEERKVKLALFSANNANVAILNSNPEGIITYINNTATTMFGYAPEEIIGKPISIFGTDEKSELFQPEDVIEALEIHKIWHGESKRRTKNGQYIPCFISVKAIEDKNGTSICNVASYLDLTPIKHSSFQIQKSLKNIISTICNSIEDRNVIKSKHQERVTDLAIAIAFKMGKSVKFIEGLTLANQLHDIGEM